MGFETMRRWPVFVIFGFCLLLSLSLLNTWATQGVLETKLEDASTQLQVCNKRQATCLIETMEITHQRDEKADMVNILEREKSELKTKLTEATKKGAEKESIANRTLVDVEMCRTELQSLKNLQFTKSAILDTLRLEKERLNEELSNKKAKIDQLEKEIANLKLNHGIKSSPISPIAVKVTPSSTQSKTNNKLVGAPIEQPAAAIDNNAKEEEEEEINPNIDGFNDFNEEPNK